MKKNIFKEFYLMLCNLIGSRRGIAFIVACVFKSLSIISEWPWFFITITFISTVLAERIFKKE
jgi:hypothetical protein